MMRGQSAIPVKALVKEFTLETLTHELIQEYRSDFKLYAGLQFEIWLFDNL